MGIVFLVVAAIGAAAAPALGRLTDRVGPARLARVALTIAVPLLVGLVAVRAAWLVAVLTVVLAGGVLGACVTPGMTWLTQATHAAELSPGASALVLNLSFAVAEAFGAIAGSRVAEITMRSSSLFWPD